jgi:site-specific DNA recombinase
VSCFKRPKLGPWLTEENAVLWDVLVATKLDRLCRNTADYLNLREWAKKHGKQVVLLSNPELDESTPAGRATATMQATFAQFERDMIVERRLETLVTLAEQGRWPGGCVPFGWRAEKRPDGYFLVPHDGGNADVLRRMAEMAIEGKSNGQIQRWLNAEGHLNSVGKPWSVERVRLVLHAKDTAKLLGESKAAEMRAALRSRTPANRGERVGGHMLLRVAYCRQCEKPLYAQVKRNKNYAYYKCIACHIYIRMDRLEGFVETLLLHAVGEREMTKRVLVAGDDHQAAIHHIAEEIETLSRISGTEAVIEAKRAEIEELKAMDYEPDHFERVPMGITIRGYWAKLDYAEQGSFLRTWGVKVKADKQGAELKTGWLDADELSVFPLRGTPAN